MTRTRWLIAGSWLIAFWLIAGMIVAPAIQRDLTASANRLLADQQKAGGDPIQIHFDGQRAILTGRLRKDSQRADLLATVQGRVRSGRLFAAKLNPVQRVTDALETAPNPTGWLLLSGNGSHGQLIGTAATDQEARDLTTLLQDRWSGLGGHIEGRLATAPATLDEATDLKTTLDTLPKPRTDTGGDSAQLQVARIGEGWQRLVLDAVDDQIKDQIINLGISAQDWEKSILPLIQNARHYQAEQRVRTAETERQAKLPPPHVFLAARDHRLLARGEMASIGIKRELLNSLIAAFPEWRVLDDIRVNPQRRAVADFGPVTIALLPNPTDKDSKTAGKSLMLGLSRAAWEPVDWQVGRDAQPWKKLLPADLPPELIQSDSDMVTDWLQGNTTGIPALPLRAQPSFLTLTLLPDKVILAGQLAEESLHTQLIEAARQKYAGQALVMAENLLVRGTCEPSSDIEQTLRSLPPLPEATSPGSIAFAKPGAVWKSISATAGIDQPGAVAKSGILPADFPAGMAEDTFQDGFSHLHQHWKSLNPGAKKAPAP
jgi:hypothetical protein